MDNGKGEGGVLQYSIGRRKRQKLNLNNAQCHTLVYHSMTLQFTCTRITHIIVQVYYHNDIRDSTGKAFFLSLSLSSFFSLPVPTVPDLTPNPLPLIGEGVAGPEERAPGGDGALGRGPPVQAARAAQEPVRQSLPTTQHKVAQNQKR